MVASCAKLEQKSDSVIILSLAYKELTIESSL